MRTRMYRYNTSGLINTFSTRKSVKVKFKALHFANWNMLYTQTMYVKPAERKKTGYSSTTHRGAQISWEKRFIKQTLATIVRSTLKWIHIRNKGHVSHWLVWQQVKWLVFFIQFENPFRLILGIHNKRLSSPSWAQKQTKSLHDCRRRKGIFPWSLNWIYSNVEPR